MTVDRQYSRANSISDAIVAIRSVNLEKRTAQGYSPDVQNITIDFSSMPAGVLSVPKIGEQWVCKSVGRQWLLVDLAPWQDERLNAEFEEGGTYIGRSGPTEIRGSRVDVPDEFYVGGTRLSGEGFVSSMKSTRFQLTPSSSHPYTFNTFVVPPFSRRAGSTTDRFELNRSGDPLGTVRIKKAGEYRIDFRGSVVGWGTINSVTLFNVMLQHNDSTIAYRSGVNYVQDSSHVVHQETSQTLYLQAEDKIHCLIYAAQSGSLSSQASWHSQLTISFVE